MKRVTVYNLATGQEYLYIGLSEREALIAAYAQSKGDYNTWAYDKYANLPRITNSGLHMSIGDVCVRLAGKAHVVADEQRLEVSA